MDALSQHAQGGETARVRGGEDIPILAATHALVVHGSLAACTTAHALASAGRETILAAAACSLPFEAVVCRRPWIGEDALRRLPDPFATAFRDSVAHTLPDGEYLLNLVQLSIRVEDLLIDAGVQLFYGMTPCGVVSAGEDRLRGVVFGGKFGLNAITAEQIVDATPHAHIAALAGVPFVPRRPGADRIDVSLSAKINLQDLPDLTLDPTIKRTASELQAVPTTWAEGNELEVAGIPELIDGRIHLHGPYAEMRLRLPVAIDNPLRYAHLCNASRRVLLALGDTLNTQRREQGKRPLLIHRLSGGLMTEPLFRLNGDLPKNLSICGPAAEADEKVALQWGDPFGGAVRAKTVAEGIERPTSNAQHPTPKADLGIPDRLVPTERDEDGIPNTEHRTLNTLVRFSDAPPLHATGDTIPLALSDLPILAECDVLVAGAGTAGVPAALAAARAGAKTVLIEQQDDVGGTHTVGGVGNYWYGRETPFHVAYNGACDTLARNSGTNMEMAMRHVLTEAGVAVLTGCATVGAIMEGDRVGGVLIATDQGVGLVKGKVTLDATGDADLAAWAGARYEYGNGRDALTLWCSFANFNQVRRTASRQYESSIEVRDPYDFTRTIVTGRRRQGMWKRFAHEMPQHYVAPRESRRLCGEATVTYRGILAGETFEDLVCVCESNFDIKGIATSDLICSGVIWSWNTHRNYRAAIPFRALLPQGVESLLVVGKAYSASHDALALARMQRDMGCMGASAGIAVATAAKNGIALRTLDIAELQEAWIAAGTLLPADLRRWAKPWPRYDAAAAERDAASLPKAGARMPEKLARLSQSGDSIGPLHRAFDAADSKALKVKIARMLCTLGDASAVPFLLDTVADQVAGGLPGPRQQTLAIPPEHGWTGEPVYSLFAVGLTDRGQAAAPLLASIAERIPDDADCFASKTDSPFEYVRVVCAVAERNPCPAMLPALDSLLGKGCLRDLCIPYDADLRLAVDSVLERRAYLELCLGRALARCGDRRGYDILLRYVTDSRGTLARSASDELHNLLGSGDEPAWRRRVTSRNGRLAVKPFTRRID